MKISSINSYFNSDKSKSGISFKQNKGVYLCSTLATGFKPTEKIPTINAFINLNMDKALGYASKIVKKGDYPYWNHSTWPKFLDDTNKEQRKIAMSACLDLVKRCDLLVYFKFPRGGMLDEIKIAKEKGIPVLTASKYLRMSKKKVDKLIEASPNYQKRMKAQGV